MTIGNWISIGGVVIVQAIAAVSYLLSDAKRKERIDWRLQSLERSVADHAHDSEGIEKINRRLTTLITILREKKVVNGHPDLSD